MEHEESFDVENFVCTPTDSGFPMSPPSPPPLSLLVPSQMNNTDLAQSAAAVKLQQDFELPDFTSAPTDAELVVDHLLPATRYRPKKSILDAVVNADLPSMDPWELPGIAGNNGKRDKYYLTDHLDLRYFTRNVEIRTPNGFWKTNMVSMIRGGDNTFIGAKKIIKFHPNTGDGALSGTKTNWIMHVYYSFGGNFVKNGLVLCHVFEEDSTDYNGSRECPTLGSHPGVCNGNHCGQAFGAPSNASFNSTRLGRSRPMHPERHYDPILLNSYIAQLENLLLGDPDPDNSADAGNCSARTGVPPTADHGQSKKRKKIISDVWDYFTKIYARDENGKVWTFAACNHCCKILTGNSSGGTTHLARHRCPCKFKPVETGRNDKASGGDVNVLSS